jgi:hypothetical protein
MSPAAIITLVVLLLVVASIFLARLALRMFFYPRPRAFPPAATDQTIEQLLARLDQALEAHARGVAVTLRPGLTEEQINALEWKHHCALSDDLRALYRWRDGMPHGEKTPDFIPGHHFVPLAEAMEMRNELRRQVSGLSPTQLVFFTIFASHRAGWLPVLDDGLRRRILPRPRAPRPRRVVLLPLRAGSPSTATSARSPIFSPA